MYRIEALNHDGEYELLKLFEDDDKDKAKKFAEDNDNYFLRVFATGNPRRLLFQNH